MGGRVLRRKAPAQRMGRPRIDLSGQRFGMLIPRERVRDEKTGHWNLWVCDCDCGGTKVVLTGGLRSGKQRSCGCRSRAGRNNGRWKGGRLRTSAGYVRVWRPGHPRANAIGYVLEHLLVMEETLGRAVSKDEEVHHKNGIRDDNRPENLELWTRSQPPGKRVPDMIKFCVAFLRKYAPERLA